MRFFNRCFLILFFNSLICLSQQDKHLDSLISLYTKAETDTDRINKYSDIGAYISAGGNYTEAITYYQKIVQTFSKSYPKKGIDAKNKIAFNFILMEAYDRADSLVNDIIEESTKLNYLKGIGLANRNKGLINMYRGNYKEAITYHLNALKVWETTKNQKLISTSYSDLGIVFYYEGNFEKAVYYWENCINVNPDKNSDEQMNNLSNLGQAYVGLEKYDKAAGYLKKVVSHYINNKKSARYTNALTGLANIEFKIKDFKQALIYYTEIIKLREGGNSRNNDLAITYLNVSLIYGEFGKPKEALEYGLKGYEKAKNSGDQSELLHAYNNLNTAYAKINNFEKAYEFSQLYNNLKDSLNNIENQKQINELDKQYQTEKKEKDNQLLSKQLEIQQIHGKEQKLYLIIAVIIVVLIGFLAIVLFNQNKNKHRTNLKLAVKNKIIEEQHKDITDSIRYAERIQQAILPPTKFWQELLPNSFVLYKPKDILSGDFYWIEQNEEYVYVAAADCTGHGVPGALMSLVNYNLLNKAVLEKNLVQTSDILDEVNKSLTVSLHQTYNESAVRDGMDIALCALHKKSNLMQFAGAFNGGYIFKKDGTVNELNGDKKPVGAFIEEKISSFTNLTISLEEGDKIFIFSDGYADQFGGPKGKKLKYSNLKKYISDSLHLDMEEQKKYLEEKFNDWKSNYEQVDDVLIIGFTV